MGSRTTALVGVLAIGIGGLVALLARDGEPPASVARPEAPAVARPEPVPARALARPAAPLETDGAVEQALAVPARQAFGEPDAPKKNTLPVSFALLAESDHSCAQTGAFQATLSRDGDDWSVTQQAQAGIVCRWSVPEEGPYTLVLDGGPWVAVERRVAIERGEDAPYVVWLTPRSLFTGLVVDAQTQRPVVDFTLIVTAWIQDASGWGRGSESITKVVHDEGGSFCISPGVADASSAALIVRADGYTSFRTGSFSANGVGVPLGKIELHRFDPCVIEVTVVDRKSGRPLADVAVRTVPAETSMKWLRFVDPPGSAEGITYLGRAPYAESSDYHEGRFVGGHTEENGRARLVVPWIDAELRLAVWSRAHQPWLSDELVPQRGSEVNPVVAALDPGALIDGRVWIEDERARHLRGLTVSLSSSRFDVSQEPKRENGERPARAFLFEGLTAGTYRVTVTAREESDLGPQEIQLGSEVVTLYDDEALTLEFGVRVPVSNVRLRGAVTSPDDASFVSLVASARAADGSGPTLGAAVRGGRFALDGIPWPRSTVTVEARDATGSVLAFWHDTVDSRRSTDLGTIDLGKTLVLVRMDPASDGFPLKPSLFAALGRGFEPIARLVGDDQGVFRIYGLPPGRYRLGYHRSDTRELEVPAEGTVELRFPESER